MMISAGLKEKIDNETFPIMEGKRTGNYVFEPSFASAQSGSAKLGDHQVVMLTSNNYLGLATNEEIKQALKQATDLYGSGTCGARLHNGTTILHRQLEQRCADYFGTEDAVILSAGYLTNVAAISAVADRDTLVVTDQLNHMSIVDGIKLSGAQVRIFRHNDMQKLEYILEKNASFNKKIIIVEGVYSMDGDLAPLRTINELSKKYGASILVDEAHSFGFIGKKGRGVSELLGVEQDVHMRMITFSKSLANVGGCIATDRKTATYIKHYANQYIFNASLPPAIVAGTLKAFDLLETEQWRVEKLWRNTIRFRKGMIHLGFDTMNSSSPVVPIYVGSDEINMKMTKELLAEGVYIATAMYPAVPMNESRLRATITAALTDDEIDFALKKFEKVGKKYELIH
ncbi:pyridoxal phosphate-dependent aminotransferase family protein [Sporolactobacillus shoreicorticis]|uniref:Aminotransferase class I/II-fold pyridoxal phosphate-dependent enzyme n=1 Tax=Sporolactobacillus shoreicorticis TaxID=1923877 RepID=A0ABW5S1E1_9BACL|nr:pyridoxal phosphate-dependent aminotransferase family protein [Sporolactobacillus shoreicorticis]MCO7124504.1 pyridoxal phosphate-dependent aminotransferase family protein [Sporolactobacillus shoreicorticis]